MQPSSALAARWYWRTWGTSVVQANPSEHLYMRKAAADLQATIFKTPSCMIRVFLNSCRILLRAAPKLRRFFKHCDGLSYHQRARNPMLAPDSTLHSYRWLQSGMRDTKCRSAKAARLSWALQQPAVREHCTARSSRCSQVIRRASVSLQSLYLLKESIPGIEHSTATKGMATQWVTGFSEAVGDECWCLHVVAKTLVVSPWWAIPTHIQESFGDHSSPTPGAWYWAVSRLPLTRVCVSNNKAQSITLVVGLSKCPSYCQDPPLIWRRPNRQCFHDGLRLRSRLELRNSIEYVHEWFQGDTAKGYPWKSCSE